jgi:hypothetical protein
MVNVLSLQAMKENNSNGNSVISASFCSTISLFGCKKVKKDNDRKYSLKSSLSYGCKL